MRGNGIRAWSPIVGGLAIGLCLFGLSIKGAPAGDEGTSSNPRRADVKSVGAGATTGAATALQINAPAPDASNGATDNPATGYSLSVPPVGNRFGADDAVRVFSSTTDAPSKRVTQRNGGTALAGDFCNCDADCATPTGGANAADDSCKVAVCTAITSGGSEVDVGEQYTCQIEFLTSGASCDLDGLFCTADECDGAGLCIVDPDADPDGPCRNRCASGSNTNETCENDLDCTPNTPGACVGVATCDDTNDICVASTGDTGRCCAYDVNGNVDIAISGYKTSTACFAAGGTTWLRVQDTVTLFRCPKYSAGIASTFDAGGALVAPVVGTEVGAVRRTDKVCQIDLTPCEDANLGCLKVCVQTSNGMSPTTQPQACATNAECATLGDGTATCQTQACAPLTCGQDSTHTLCTAGEAMRCPGDFRIGDDYSVSNGSFIALKQFSYRGGVNHANQTLVFDFWDNTGPATCTADGAACSFIGESCAAGAGLCWGPIRVAAFAVGQNSGNTADVRTVSVDCEPDCFGNNVAPSDPEFRIPGTGYVTMRSSRAFGGKANGFWRTAGVPDVGTNDAVRAWKNGGPTVDDSLVVGANNDMLAFEIVGDKIPEPLGACCGLTQLVCSDSTLASECVGLLAGAACGTATGTCILSNQACDDVHRYECRTCQGGGPRLGALCSATGECSPLGSAVSICSGTSWKGARFNSTTPSACISDVCNIGGCCNNGVCTDTTLALCTGNFLGGGSVCSAAVTRQQGGAVTAFTDPNHNCCPQSHTYGACCSDTPYCAGDASANTTCTAGNTGTNCGTLFCENYPFNFVCVGSSTDGDADCGQGAVVGTVCGTGGTCQVPCGGVAGDACSSTPFCSGVLGNPPCSLVCSDTAGDCTGSVVGAACGVGGTCGTAALGSTCFGSGVCTQSTCVQPVCDFCTGPVLQTLDVLNSPTSVCANSGGGCDTGNANGGICDCPQNAGICNFVCADGPSVGTACTLSTELTVCGAGFTCGVPVGAPNETCTAGLPLLTLTLSGTRPLKDDPQMTGLTRVFDFDDGDECTLNPTDPGIYEVFEVTDFSRVTVDLCCKNPVFAGPYIVLFEACSCTGFDFILSNIGEGGTGNTGLFGAANNNADIRCEADTNLSMTFDLPPGKYAYPINSDRQCTNGGGCDDILDCPSGQTCDAQAERDYQVHISAVKAQRAACCSGVSCTVTTKLECEGNDQLPTASLYFPGGPNSIVVGGNWLGSQGPETAIVGTPVADCSTNVCSLGSCCGGAGGVASCDDMPNGGLAGDGISEATCASRTGGQGIYQGGVRCSDDPCPACPLDVNTQCQMDFASISDTSDRHHKIRAADDFIPNAATIGRICWSGVWGVTNNAPRCNDNPPDTNWYLTIYADDGNGIPDPNNIIVGPELLITHDGRKIVDLQAAFKPTSYSAPVNIAGLTPGNCYWIEILGEGTGDLSSQSCNWNWFYTDTSGGQGSESPSQDGNGWSVHVFGDPADYTAANLVKNDRAWCADSGIAKNTVGNEGLDGGCGDRTGTFACCYRDANGAPVCTSTVSLFKCILNPVDMGLAGTAFTGVSCPDAGGTHTCAPPANDDCVTGAQQILSASCPAVTNVGNCAKNKASWCSPLFSACAGTDGLCIPIMDDNSVESTGQFDCAVVGTDNRFATGDGPPSQNNTTVIDDCSGSDNGGGPFRADVWYKVTAPCAGKMSVTMCGNGVYDAMMASYTACPDGNDATAPNLIECNDDACGTFGTVSELPATNVALNQEVAIRIGGWSANSAAVQGTDGEAGQGISGLHVRFACFVTVPTVLPLAALTGEPSFTKDRYISADASANGTTPVAIQVTRVGSTTNKYVDCTSLANLGADGWYAALIDGPLPAPGDATYYCDMSAVTELHIRGCNVVPGNTYSTAVTTDGVGFSSDFPIDTTPPQSGAGRQFGDVVGGLIAGVWTAPDGLVTASDIVAVVQKFSSAPGAPIISRVNNSGAVPNTIVSAAGDVLRAVSAFGAADFSFGVIDCLTGTCLPPQGGACE